MKVNVNIPWRYAYWHRKLITNDKKHDFIIVVIYFNDILYFIFNIINKKKKFFDNTIVSFVVEIRISPTYRGPVSLVRGSSTRSLHICSLHARDPF